MFRNACQRLLQCKSLIEKPCARNLSASYKSKLSLEKLYPHSDQNPIAYVTRQKTSAVSTERKKTRLKPASDRKKDNTKEDNTKEDNTKEDNTKEESFSGIIPIGDLGIQYLRSSGPGGQNVNKVNSKVQIRFNVDKAEWIPNWIKPKLKEREEGRITKDGEMIVWSEKTRKQFLNQADCLDKIRHMIFQASIKPKEPTKEELELREKRKEISNEKRLQEKRKQSLRRQSRNSDYY